MMKGTVFRTARYVIFGIVDNHSLCEELGNEIERLRKREWLRRASSSTIRSSQQFFYEKKTDGLSPRRGHAKCQMISGRESVKRIVGKGCLNGVGSTHIAPPPPTPVISATVARPEPLWSVPPATLLHSLSISHQSLQLKRTLSRVVRWESNQVGFTGEKKKGKDGWEREMRLEEGCIDTRRYSRGRMDEWQSIQLIVP